ncbi:cytochrome P450 93A3-like [Cryptomeria japonica]|uniref:cytochrome P450 93A3-like n=1 Tax=Cryptomeria japonica TaxID=3369 RepID=UPI0027DA53BE|nr:cytochrome P450 93A3-like [Cryptomeria japonica]
MTSIVGLVFAVLIISMRRGKGKKLPPGPFGLPVIGHMHLFAGATHLHHTLHNLSMKYGPLMQIRLGSVLSVVVSSPEMAKEFLKTHDSKFSSRPQMSAIKYMAYNYSDFTFAPYGPYWKFMRKICVLELLGGRQLEQFKPIKKEEMILLLQTVYKRSVVDMASELTSLANNVISRMAMSTRCSGTDAQASECKKIVQEVIELTGKFNLGDYIFFCKNLDLQGYERQMKDVHRRFDNIMNQILEQHEQQAANDNDNDDDHVNGRPKDLIDILLSISKDKQAEVKLTTDNIKGTVLDLFTAGTDTSSIATEWALAEVIRNPEILNKAREEIMEVVGSGRLVEESDIPKMVYLQSIVKESLRLHPPGPLALRESTEECNIDGYFIPAKTRVFINIWAIGRDPKHWENPLEFRPERFSESSIDVRGQNFQILPFGGGRRGCPGTSLALSFIHIVLANMIHCFDWKLVNEEGGTMTMANMNMEEGVGFTAPRAVPLKCKAAPRFPQVSEWLSC